MSKQLFFTIIPGSIAGPETTIETNFFNNKDAFNSISSYTKLNYVPMMIYPLCVDTSIRLIPTKGFDDNKFIKSYELIQWLDENMKCNTGIEFQFKNIITGVVKTVIVSFTNEEDRTLFKMNWG